MGESIDEMTKTDKIDLVKLKKETDETLSKFDILIEQIERQRSKIKKELDSKIEKLQLSKYNTEELSDFFDEPYVVIPKRENEYYVIAPRWLDFQIGWLERQTKSYNIFIVNRYIQWIAQVPSALQDKLKFPTPLPIKVFDGVVLTGKEHQDEVWNKYNKFLTRREGKDRIKIKKRAEFKFIAQLIEDGILPFMPRPIEPEDLREWDGIKLRSYQQTAWDSFKDKGACGIYWCFGAGKSLFGVYALGRIKGRKLVVVPTLTLKEQWLERLMKYLPEQMYEVEVVTYHAYDKCRNKEYNLVIFDEAQHLPANTFIRLATLKTKYRLGFSGSPFREDKRENYIFALTGFPIGISWDELLKLQVIKELTFRLYILPDNRSKVRKLDELLRIPVKTIIFCDSISFGERISKEFEIPFVHGATRDRLDIIRKADVSVVSRVGDEGISIPELERVIEVSFLFGSRMQESQRFGRLMHSQEKEPQHIIMMTEQEFDKYQKRLYAITERGFKIEVIR